MKHSVLYLSRKWFNTEYIMTFRAQMPFQRFLDYLYIIHAVQWDYNYF
jgi:hypothetical protein